MLQPREARSRVCAHAKSSLEQVDGVDRHHFDAVVSKQDMLDTYLPAFHACVEDANASSIMCSYNEVNGIPSCADSGLLSGIARKGWSFDGYITSDCGAVDDILNRHRYTADANATVAAVLSAGMDTDCGSFVTHHLGAALESGSTTAGDVQRALSNLVRARAAAILCVRLTLSVQLRVQFRLGMFDPAESQPYKSLAASDVNTAAAQELALQAARESIVLLKNDNGRLPLPTHVSVAAVGPHANATTALQGAYGLCPRASRGRTELTVSRR